MTISFWRCERLQLEWFDVTNKIKSKQTKFGCWNWLLKLVVRMSWTRYILWPHSVFTGFMVGLWGIWQRYTKLFNRRWFGCSHSLQMQKKIRMMNACQKINSISFINFLCETFLESKSHTLFSTDILLYCSQFGLSLIKVK